MAVDTSLSERKLTILKAIIQNYLETGEPVGSRTLSKYTDLNLSSATIRNEMADLEDLGYIFQPHTSAGRIPSDKGYRLYVDMLMEEKEQEIAKRERPFIYPIDENKISLYIGIPFCPTRCYYCSFPANPLKQSEYAEIYSAFSS